MINQSPFYKGRFIALSSLKYSQIHKVFAAFCASIEQKPSLCKIFDLKARRFRVIFVLLGRSKAWCLARNNRAKSAEIRRFQAGSDLSLYPTQIPGSILRPRYVVFYSASATASASTSSASAASSAGASSSRARMDREIRLFSASTSVIIT